MRQGPKRPAPLEPVMQTTLPAQPPRLQLVGESGTHPVGLKPQTVRVCVCVRVRVSVCVCVFKPKPCIGKACEL